MKRRFFLFSIFIVCCLWQCKTNEGITYVNPEKYHAIRDYFQLNKSKKLYVKSISGPSLGASFPELLEYDFLNNSHDVLEKRFGIESEEIFSIQELQRFRTEAKKMTEIAFNKEFLGTTEISKNKNQNNTLAITIPMISDDSKYALIYVESVGGGDLLILKRFQESWKLFSIVSVWVS